VLADITPIVITWNEEPNIARVFGRLSWATRVVVVDSGSTDGTLELLARYPNVRVFIRSFVSHADQTNFALRETGITTEWVLSIDADYVLSESILAEIGSLVPRPDVAGYSAAFQYWTLGQPLRGSLYPPRVVLFRRSAGAYEQHGHAHRLRLQGQAVALAGPIFHDDRKPLSRWIVDQDRYASLEARRLLENAAGTLDWADRIRRAGVLAPPLVAVYCLIVKRCAVAGRAGWYYTLQRVVAEALLAMRLWEMKRDA
jgi:glycosyltransferase involved in cell wall biosynthesis